MIDYEILADSQHYYRVVYILWSVVIIEPIAWFLKIYKRVTDEAKLAETS